MGSIIEVIGQSDKLKGVADTMKIAGLVDMLNAGGPFTILAPNDEAFAQVPRSFFRSLLENKRELKKTVLYHIIPEELNSKKLEEMMVKSSDSEVKTMEGHEVVFRSTGNLKRHFMVNDATIVSTDLKADNGVIHTIDKVLFVKKK